jgi:hypothetical protein
MQCIAMQSSVLLSAGYTASSETLVIEFHGGEIYRYSPVPEPIWHQLLAAESKGTCFNASIRDRFPTTRLPRIMAANHQSNEN